MSNTKTKILIADDEESLRTLLSAVVSSNDNFELVTAIDGDDALIKINENKPDILILDVMMPGQSGFEVCETIKNNDKLSDIKVIILTAKGQESDREWAESVGADHFLSKPFSPLELLELLKNISGDL
jgi:two-component system, OmpR family, alkaline phosphatase synthesis response regulator PhoP